MAQKIKTILSDDNHRPWPMSTNPWRYYQEWLDLLFLHFQVHYDLLRPLVPAELQIDQHEGSCYVSLVAFKMKNIRPRNLPAFPPISDFYEINVRTYIDQDGKKGVYFIHIEASKSLSAFIAKKLSGLPYEKSTMLRNTQGYHNLNQERDFRLKTIFAVTDEVKIKSSLDTWLTERYCLYLDKPDGIYCFDIHHSEWPLFSVQLQECQLNYRVGDIHLHNENIALIHYSPGVQVLAWNAVMIKPQQR
ncbi:YqjF family protein [Sphingobacterium sp. NGMCC 1.201703]|uniref:YqjF family protein n=1 Tax=Sphingobacterium sp. NGMCC 1.201703 TaxID=3388657 RepID=UPI0039FC9473